MNHNSQSARLLEAALQQHRTGRLQQAERLYKQVLAQEPNNIEANHLLGVIACQGGEFETGAQLIRKALRLKPDYAGAHKSLGKALQVLGRLDEAAASFRRALELMPEYAEACNDLGIVLLAQSKIEDAKASFQKAAALKPGFAEAHYNLGNLFYEQRNFNEAAASFRQAIVIRPNHAAAHNNLGNALKHLNRHKEALVSFQKAIAINPGYAEAHNNLGNLLNDQGKYAEAAACCRRAIVLNPDFAAAHSNLGNAFFHQGLMVDAVASFRQAAELGRDNAYFTNLLLTLNYLPGMTQEEIYTESLQWGDRLLANLQFNNDIAYSNNKEKERRLRIGYISPDFRAHSVAYFFEPVLKGHSRKNFEIFCYANVQKPDAASKRMQDEADHWFSITGLDDDAAAAQIRRDHIDILVDLAGHTGDNRLPVLARRPAPVQVTWLGYPNTTGLRIIDYRLTDHIADPPGEADRLHSENLVRLEHGFLCYQPDAAAPEVAPLPCLRSGYITFGSFNNLAKVSPEVIMVWAQILAAVPESHLLLKAKQLGNDETRDRYVHMFGAAGIAADRLELHSRLPQQAEHLALYSRVDIGLDPFPYNGTATTCEALWMGVPVVTLLGDRHAGRVGASILHRLKLDELVAESPDEYAALALALATDLKRLSEMRASLRSRMLGSTLMDRQLFIRTLEHAFRRIWRRWCDPKP